VHDQEQGDLVKAVGSPARQVIEAPAQPLRETEALKELLEDYDPGEGSELLILEPELGHASR
jgi:hypothetical protein